jgi:hypothetical protein
MVLANVGNYLPSDTASLPRRLDSSHHWWFVLITIFVSNLVAHTQLLILHVHFGIFISEFYVNPMA